jgi:tRNA(Ile)-lysidine synthase
MRPLEAGLRVCDERLDARSVAPVAVAFSGGGDSLALLLTARAWARRRGRPLLALHVDHGLHRQSAAFAAQAKALAGRLGAPIQILPWEGAKPVTGVPAAARAARHRLIADAARAAGARVVLLGHTLDDQLENALMRGAGVPVGALRDWSASPIWPQGRDLFYCRPLLTARRAVLRDWLAAEGLNWIEDPANGDPRHPRTVARQALTAGVTVRSAPAADIVALASACQVTPWGAIAIERARLRAASEPEALRLLQIALACASGAPGSARAGGLSRRLRGPDAFVASLAGARIVAGERIRLLREAGEAARGGLAPLDLGPGQEGVWDGRWAVRAGAAGLKIRALAGLAARLEPSDVGLLRAIPASDRPSLPVLQDSQGRVRLAGLATRPVDDQIQDAVGSIEGLVELRIRGACGLIVREDRIGTISRMAESRHAPYVGTEAKG